MDTTLKSLRYFMAAVNCGSITEASKKMHVVPSAIHTAVIQVEDSFGLKLTIRNRSKGVALTATGQQMMVKIQHLLDEYETLMREGSDMRSVLTGTLRVGYYAPVAPSFMPRIIRKLIKGNADVEVKFFECDNQAAQSGLIAGTYDVIVCVATSMKSEITYETLMEVPAYLLVSEKHAFANKKTLPITALNGEDVVLLDLPVVSEYYSQVLKDAKISPRITSTATTVEMVRSLVGTGLGCSMLHMQPATKMTYSGDKVISIPLDPPVEPLNIVLGHLPENPRRLVKAFVDELRDYFESKEAQKMRVTLG